MQSFEFRRPGGVVIAGMGVLFIGAAVVGLGMALFMMNDADLKTILLVLAGVAGACALGFAFINAWRQPLLAIRPDALVIPTFFDRQRIAVRPGHPLGEFLASPDHPTKRPGTIEGNKFVHFFTLDDRGKLTKLIALHRDSPDIARIRRALQEVAGLKTETLRQDPGTRINRPDVAHWRHP